MSCQVGRDARTEFDGSARGEHEKSEGVEAHEARYIQGEWA